MVTPVEGRESAGRRLERLSPGYLAKIRRDVEQIGLPATPAARTRRAVDLLAEISAMNPPVVGRTSRRRLIRRTITFLTRLYVAFFAGQVTDIGLSASLMGGTLLEYVADLEKEVADLRSRLERLEEGRAAS